MLQRADSATSIVLVFVEITYLGLRKKKKILNIFILCVFYDPGRLPLFKLNF